MIFFKAHYSLVDWIEANMNSITNKEDDFVDNQKAKRQKVGDENEKIRDHVMFSPTMDLHRTFPYQIMEPALSPPIWQRSGAR